MFGGPQFPGLKRRKKAGPTRRAGFTFKWWLLALVFGAGAALFFAQAPAWPAPDEAVSAAPAAPESGADQAQPAPPGAESGDGFLLPEYDPAADEALSLDQDPADARPFWLVSAELALKLLLVIGLIYAALRGLRWLQGGRRRPSTGGATIRVLETVGLTPGHSLHLVVVGEKTLLLGATEQQLSLLAELAELLPETEEEPLFDEMLGSAQDREAFGAGPDWQAALDGLRAGVRRLRAGGGEERGE